MELIFTSQIGLNFKFMHKPTNNNFVFCPSSYEILNEFVDKIQLNFIDKKINIIIRETPKMDVLKWISYIFFKYEKSKKSPFEDQEYSSILLKIMDENIDVVSTIRFTTLKVIKHKCSLERNSSDPLKELIHYLSISYEMMIF